MNIVKKRQKTKFHRKPILVAVIIMTAVIVGVTVSVFSLFNTSTATNINPDTVPDATLIVGTHLIYIESLNDELYEIAKASGQDSNQTDVYYKSELADGNWYVISAAGSIKDITTKGTMVSKDVISKLYVRYHTKEDGITYDLLNGKPVNIFNIKNPYDIGALPELDPAKLQYDFYREAEAEDETIDFFSTLFDRNLRDSNTNTLDEYIGTLQAYYERLCSRDATPSEKNAVLGVEGAVDAARRLIIYNKLSPMLEASVKAINGKTNVTAFAQSDASSPFNFATGSLGTFSTRISGDEDDDPDDIEYSEIAGSVAVGSAYEESYNNVQDSLAECSAKALGEGTTVASKVKYKYQNSLIEHCRANDDANSALDVKNIVALDNISSAQVVDRERELRLLNEELIPEAERIFERDKSSGENGEYKTEVSKQASTVVLNRLQDDFYDMLSMQVTELEVYLNAKCIRIPNSEAQKLIESKLEKAYTYVGNIPTDDFAVKAQNAVQDYITWLEQTLSELKAAAGGGEKDLLQAKKDQLEAQYEDALADNNLALAKSIMSEINDITAQIQELGESGSPNSDMVADLKNTALNLISSIASEGPAYGADSSAGAGASGSGSGAGSGTSGSGSGAGSGTSGSGSGAGGAGSGSTNANLSQLENILGSLNALMETDYKTAFPAVQQLLEAMRDQKYSTSNAGKSGGAGGSTQNVPAAATNNAFDGAIDLAKGIIAENIDLYEAGMVGIKDPAEVEGILDDALDEADDLTGAEKDACKLSAMNNAIAAASGSPQGDALKNKMNALAQKMKQSGNPYVFEKIRVANGLYAPVNAVAQKLGWRYVWYVSRNNAVLAKGSQRYEFSSFSKVVTKNGTNSEMSIPAMTQKLLYIPSSYISSEWGFITIYLSGSDYGVLLDADAQDAADELTGMIIE
ncbi:MAG: copper amine oxidase N-terminal domain-containing protein [Clostridia bacterium]|nr:copper amine oxidase N-terminal domain-containing protein [Clostridia bacterium]